MAKTANNRVTLPLTDFCMSMPSSVTPLQIERNKASSQFATLKHTCCT